jgi:hypothetical protein
MDSMKRIPAALVLLGALLFAGASSAQSGRSVMRGYVAFEGLSYNDVAERKVNAKIELLRNKEDKDPVTTQTTEHGSYDFGSVAPGEYVLRISSPGYKVYETEIYLPSDFICNLGVILRKLEALKIASQADEGGK